MPPADHKRCANEEHAVQRAPHEKRPTRAVPQSAEYHREHQVQISAKRAVPVAAERDVKVVPQEPRERHVPPPPEIGDARCEVWSVEVLRPAVTEQEADSARHVGMRGEVEVDLQCVEPHIRQRPDPCGRRVVHVREKRVDGDGDSIRDDELLEEPACDEPQPLRRAPPVLAEVARAALYRGIRLAAESARRRGAGRNTLESVYRQKFASAGVVFRYTSIIYAIPVNA